MQAPSVNTRRNRTVFEAGGDTVDDEPPTRRSRVNGTEEDVFASPPNVRSTTKQPDVAFTSPEVGTSSIPVHMSSSSQSHSGASAFQSPSGLSNHSEASNSSKKRKRSTFTTQAFIDLEIENANMRAEKLVQHEREMHLERIRALECERALERQKAIERDRALEARKRVYFLAFGNNDDENIED